MKGGSNKRFAWLALHLTPGLGRILFKRLLEAFGEPEAALAADLPQLLAVKGMRKAVAWRIHRHETVQDPAAELTRLEKTGGRLVTYRDADYPALLREIHDPPMVLYAKGKKLPPDALAVAVVGSRNASYYGIQAAQRLASSLARNGVVVVSGMARGIDAAAHTGCLQAGGFTVAVLGTGLDVPYPRAHRGLAAQVADGGVLLTEFPMGTPPEPRNFPVRNRIISGLSRGVVVVEAAQRSGSLITAGLALEQGREVFAVPGSIGSLKSRGTHHLIRQGAKLVEGADDVLEEFGLGPARQRAEAARPVAALAVLAEDEKRLYEVVEDTPMHVDEIVRRAGMDPGAVLGILMRLELRGLVRQLPGKYFVR